MNQQPAAMKLNEPTGTVDAGAPHAFCTCRDMPDSVDVEEPAAQSATPWEAPTPVPYCTCQHAAPDFDDVLTIPTGIDAEPESEGSTDEDEGATEASGQPQEETILYHFDTEDGDIELTDRRVVMHGNAADSPTIWASMSIEEVSGARIDREKRGIRGWLWAAVGLAATIAIWQILDGGGWIRLAFPGLVGVSTIILLVTTLLAPLNVTLTVSGRHGTTIDTHIASDHVDEATAFAEVVIAAAHDAAQRERNRRDAAD